MLGLVFAIFSVLAFSVSAQSVQTQTPLEVWLYRPVLPIEISPEIGKTNISVADKVEAVGVQAKLHAKNIHWDGNWLRLGPVSGTLSTEKISSPYFSFPGIRFDILPLKEIAFSFPDSIALKAEEKDGHTRFVLADDSLKQYLDAQLDRVLTKDSFMIRPSGGGSDLGAEFARTLADVGRDRLLEEAKKRFQQALTTDLLSDFLVVGGRGVPDGFPAQTAQGQWVLKRHQAFGTTLWRLAPAGSSPYSVYVPPAIDPRKQNVLTVVASRNLVQDLIARYLQKQSKSTGFWELEPPQAMLLAKTLGIELEGASLGVVTEGARAPQARFWSLGSGNQARYFMDLLVCLKETSQSEEEYHVGLILEFGKQGAPQLVLITPIHGAAAESQENLRAMEGWKSLQATLGRSVVQQVANSQLDEAHNHWVSASDKLVPLGIRAIGDQGPKSPGAGRWMQALAIDYEVR